MQVTKELLDNDIVQLEAQIENLKSQLAQSVGAHSTLKNIRTFLEAPEPEPDKPSEQNPSAEYISAANKAIQDNLEAMSVQDVAEAVAGPGAVVEAIEEVGPTDGYGKYPKKGA